eukprot:CAMPEP_0182427614 /NCGR_PEP_ID=MMETSP1167-20130531/18915_1 /TAXON_ID=2988 /ORGANISM="Mallomonas Sp, Strain CCMP3275" /LENGTH=170 /DNA_ID=CAMNT_0024609975 /DNA_START=93 /DNA_END=605 /DNA_ORIENTATION=-
MKAVLVILFAVLFQEASARKAIPTKNAILKTVNVEQSYLFRGGSSEFGMLTATNLTKFCGAFCLLNGLGAIFLSDQVLELWDMKPTEETRFLNQIIGLLSITHGAFTYRAAHTENDLDFLGKVNTATFLGLSALLVYGKQSGVLKSSNALKLNAIIHPLIILSHLFVFWQ